MLAVVIESSTGMAGPIRGIKKAGFRMTVQSPGLFGAA